MGKKMRPRFRPKSAGLTLIEVMVATAIILIAVIGAMGYRYYSTLDARTADIRMTATKMGSMLLEGWVGACGDSSYNPAVNMGDLQVVSTGSGPSEPADFTVQGSYNIKINDSDYYATLSFKEAGDGLNLRVLNANIAWKNRGVAGVISDADPSIRMTTYVGLPEDPNS